MIAGSEEAGLAEGMGIVQGGKRNGQEYRQTRGKPTGDDTNTGGDRRKGRRVWYIGLS